MCREAYRAAFDSDEEGVRDRPVGDDDEVQIAIRVLDKSQDHVVCCGVRPVVIEYRERREGRSQGKLTQRAFCVIGEPDLICVSVDAGSPCIG